MDQLIELLKQIQELAGVGVDALKGASHGGEHGGPPQHGAPPHGGPPQHMRPGSPEDDAEDRKDGGADEAAEGEPPFRR